MPDWGGEVAKLRDLFELNLFNEDGSFAENGGCTKPAKLLVSGQVDYAGDITAQFEPAEPYEFIK